MTEITVIIVEYKTPERTLQYIRDLMKSADIAGGLSFVIVDNDPDADHTALFALPELRIRYVRAGENGGFAKANNLGARIADEAFSPDFYLFSNSDLILPERFDLSVLVRCLDGPAFAAAGPRVMSQAGITLSPFRKADIVGKYILTDLLWPVNLLIPHVHRMNRSIIDDPVTGPCYAVVGAFMLMKPEAFRQVGGFDEHTFLYGEEVILAERLEAGGYQEYYCDEVSLIHEEGGSTDNGSRGSLRSLIRKRERVYESERYYYEACCHVPRAMLTLADLTHRLFIFKLKLYALLKGEL